MVLVWQITNYLPNSPNFPPHQTFLLYGTLRNSIIAGYAINYNYSLIKTHGTEFYDTHATATEFKQDTYIPFICLERL